MKKFLNHVLCIVFVLSILSQVSYAESAFTFSDCPKNAWYYEDVNYASEHGWVNGYGNGTFGPNDSVSVAQAAVIVSRALGITYDAGTVWYENYIKNGIEDGFVESLDNYNRSITRAEIAEMIFKAYKIDGQEYINKIIKRPFVDIDNIYVNVLNYLGIIRGIDTKSGVVFQPDANLTRAQFCAIIRRMDSVAGKYNQIDIGDNNDKQVVLDIVENIKGKYLDTFNSSGTIYNENTFKNELFSGLQNGQSEIEYATNGADGTMVMNNLTDWFTSSQGYMNKNIDYFGIYGGFSNTMTIGPNGNSGGTFTIVYGDHYVDENEALADRYNLYEKAYMTVERLRAEGKIYDEMTEYAKAKAIAEWICDNVTYDTNYSGTASSYGTKAFVDGKIICGGYTSLYNAMLRVCGIEAYGMVGWQSVDKTGHVWTIAILGGQPYVCDITFMDAADGYTADIIRRQRDTYFGMTINEYLNFVKDIRVVKWSADEFKDMGISIDSKWIIDSIPKVSN